MKKINILAGLPLLVSLVFAHGGGDFSHDVSEATGLFLIMGFVIKFLIIFILFLFSVWLYKKINKKDNISKGRKK